MWISGAIPRLKGVPRMVALCPPLLACFIGVLFALRHIGRQHHIWPPSHSQFSFSARPKLNTRGVAVESLTSQTLAPADQVRFDNYSLFIRDQRFFLHSGEFHTFRLPVPSLWADILQKAKAAGLNAISIYVHMGLINPSRGVVDFDGYRALQPLYDAAKDAGLFVVVRPGPYINAETSAGGIAHWVTSEVAGELRSNATDYKEAWQAYIKGVINETSSNQITENGPVIAMQVDNEFSQTPDIHAQYFADLEDVYHNSTIVVPLTYNDPFQSGSFVNGTGAVDLYGLDSYPQGSFNCSSPTVWRPVVTNYHEYHETVNPSQPWYIPEFQSGVLDVWGPSSPGYTPCLVKTGADYLSVFNLQLWASNAKLINYYMFYGGTSWGALPYPAAYTSYDYGASISESRLLTSKYDEMKRQGIFLRSSPEFYKTDWISDTNAGGVFTTSPRAFVTFLRNPDTHAGFYIIRQADSTSISGIDFKLNVSTLAGDLEIPIIAPAITLAGRQSRVIVTNYAFGSSKLLYSTASIFFAGDIDGRDVIFLYGDIAKHFEIALKLKGTPQHGSAQSSSVKFTPSAGGHTIISIVSGTSRLITIFDSEKQLVLFADPVTVATFWAPIIAGSDTDPLKNYWGLGTNATILVGGPYLVRSANISDGLLDLRGDLNASVSLSVIASKSVRSITWNGKRVDVDSLASSTLTAYGGFVANLRTEHKSIKIPVLEHWKFADSLPEIHPEFSDSKWTRANHTITNCPRKPYYGDGRVLYGCDYGFCENIVLWRGHFIANGNEKSMNLSINGGQAFAASVWLNSVFLNTSFGNSSANRNVLEETDDKFFIPPEALNIGRDNVVTIVQDNMGMNETGLSPTSNDPKSPRGIRGFYLDGGEFSEWMVQGKIGGYTGFPDKQRGVLNEGGLYGERQGWHLPGFDTSKWTTRDLSLGLPNSVAGIGFFSTSFQLDIPAAFDVLLSFTFEEPFGQPYRAYLFVNGWMMGKRIGNLGPQSKFPVQQGILDYSGTNSVSVALWALLPNVTIAPKLQLTMDDVLEGGIGPVKANNPSWSAVGRL